MQEPVGEHAVNHTCVQTTVFKVIPGETLRLFPPQER